jgi:hypothetical protein
MDGFELLDLIVALVILFVFFLLIREIICWYYKINRSIELQEESIRLLKKLVDLNTPKTPEESNINLSSNERNVNDPEVMNKIIADLENK